MSSSNQNVKAKPKQKKSQQFLELQQRFTALKKQNLQMSITIKKLTEKAIEMKLSQRTLNCKFQAQVQSTSAKIQQLEIIKVAQSQRLNRTRQQKEELQIENGCLKYKIQRIAKQFDEHRAITKTEYAQLRKTTEAQIKKYQNTVGEYQSAINQRTNYQQANSYLERELISKAEEQKRIIADKDRDKLQTVDFLKKQMLEKSKEMRSNLLTMRRQQMATNSRLTALQNQQLLEELQYQSKNTQKILKRNQELEKNVKDLTKQMQLQKQIEQQLAKRSTISKKILKNLNQKTVGLQRQLQQKAQHTQQSTIENSLPQTPKKRSRQYNPALNSKQESTLSQYLSMIPILQRQLSIYQTKIAQIEKEKLHFQKLYEDNHPNYVLYLKTQNDLRTLMIRFLNQNFDGTVIGDGNNVYYDISRLKGKDVEDWMESDIQITVKMLLTFLKPHFNMKNMKAEYFKYTNHQNNQNDILDDVIVGDQKFKKTQKTIHTKAKHLKMKSLSSAALNNSKAQGKTENYTSKKQFSLHNVFQDYKRKSTFKKQRKSQSQHYLSNVDDKTIHNELQSFNLKESKQNINSGFRPQDFRNKESKKLIRTSFRDWGKKVQMYPKTPIIN